MFKIVQEFAKGPGIIISAVMWEFFSINGLRALLMYYLTQQLLMTDAQADQLYTAYIALIWLSPLIGGWLADRFFGFKDSVMIGGILIILGHIVISCRLADALTLGLSLLICGIGFFKTNAICLVSRYYQDQPQKLSAVMTLYYVGANIGATFAPIVCAYLQQAYGYDVAFLAAALGMAVGLLGLLLAGGRLKGVGDPPPGQRWSLKRISKLSLGLCLAVMVVALVLNYNLVSLLLVIAFVLVSRNLFYIIRSLSVSVKKRLLILLALTLLATLFWVLDQQVGSSLSLFIARNVSRLGLPAAVFQSINPVMVIIGGLMLTAWLSNNYAVFSILQLFQRVCIGMALLTVGYVAIAWTADMATNTGMAPMWGVVFGLAIMGIAELFIDPVILAGIGRCVPASTLGSFTAVYYLFVGALANDISGYVAGFSAIPRSLIQSANKVSMAKIYAGVFSQIAMVCVFVIIVLLMLWLFFKIRKIKFNLLQCARYDNVNSI